MLEAMELLIKTPIKITANSPYNGGYRLSFDDHDMFISWHWNPFDESIALNYSDFGLDVEVSLVQEVQDIVPLLFLLKIKEEDLKSVVWLYLYP